MITSKGATGVTGSGFITLAATLAVVPGIPVAGMALILGIDKFMSEARAITNHIGNCTAAVVMASWEKELDWGKFNAELGRGHPESEGREVFAANGSVDVAVVPVAKVVE
jgi:aerobic C4-dicarboxylate transport protein